MPKTPLALAQGLVRAREHDLEMSLRNQREVERRVTQAKDRLSVAKDALWLLEEPLRIEAERRAQLEAENKAETLRLWALADAAYENWGREAAIEWFKCGRKVLHYSEEQAAAAIAPNDPTMHPYFCVYCTGWHIGHGTDSEPPKDAIVRKIVVALRKKKL